MIGSLVLAGVLLAAQTPDGAGPSVPDPSISTVVGGGTEPAPETAPPPPGFVAPPPELAAPAAEVVPPDVTPPGTGEPNKGLDLRAWDTTGAEDPASVPGATTVAEPTPTPAPEAAAPRKAKARGFTLPRFKKDPWGGVVVAGLGGAIVSLGASLAVTALTLAVAPVPFPGGDAERNGAAGSALVGTVFCTLVGATMVAVGAVLVGVAFY